MGVFRPAGVGRLFLTGSLLAAMPALGQQLPMRDAASIGIGGPVVRSGVELRAGGTRSDNIERGSQTEKSDTMATLGATIDAAHDSRLLHFSANGDIDWVEYLDDTYDSRALGTLDANLLLDFVPERFSWITQGTFGQLETDPFAPTTPDNLEDVVYLTSGPVLQLNLGAAARLVLTGTYSIARYEDTALDSDRYGGSVALVRAVSDASAISLNVASDRIEFDEQLGADYDHNSAYVRYEATGARTVFAADVGYSEIKTDTAVDDQNGLLFRVTLDRRITPSSVISLHATDQFSDSSEVFRSSADSRNLSRTTYAISTAAPVEERGYGVAWSFSRPRTAFMIGANRNEEVYDQAPNLNREVTELIGGFQRRLGPVMTLTLEVRHDDEEFAVGNFDDQELAVRTELRWAIGRRAGAGLRLERFDRDSSNPLTEYTENRIGLSFYWRAIAPDE